MVELAIETLPMGAQYGYDLASVWFGSLVVRGGSKLASRSSTVTSAAYWCRVQDHLEAVVLTKTEIKEN